jgi:hypothetical protein
LPEFARGTSGPTRGGGDDRLLLLLADWLDGVVPQLDDQSGALAAVCPFVVEPKPLCRELVEGSVSKLWDWSRSELPALESGDAEGKLGPPLPDEESEPLAEELSGVSGGASSVGGAKSE